MTTTDKPSPPVRQNPTPEMLATVIDAIAEGCTFNDAMARVGRKGNTIFSWLSKSRQGVEGFTLAWPDGDGPQISFDAAVVLAQRAHLLHFRQRLVRDVDIGTPRTLRTPNGDVIFEKDAKLLAEWGGDTPEARDEAYTLGGIVDYPFKHDADGARVPAIEYIVSAAAIRQHVARSLLEGFNPADRQERDTRVSGKIMIANATRQGALPSYARPVPAPISPLRADLERQLALVQERGPTNPKPETPPTVYGRPMRDDPPERTQEPSRTINPADHPRAYQASVPTPKGKPDTHPRPQGHGRSIAR